MKFSSDVTEWAIARRDDLIAREFDNSLRTVGRDKPLGSLGAYTRWGVVQVACRTLCLPWLWLRQLDYRVLTVSYADASGRWSGMRIYLYHLLALTDLIMKHKNLLETLRWPTDTDGFIERIGVVTVPPSTPLYDLIADAYGDKLNPGRLDVLPGLDRAVLFAAYARLTEEADPAFVFFDQATLDRADQILKSD